jgi:hypothetical protein
MVGVGRMTRAEKVVNILAMMGYEIYFNPYQDFVRVSLKTNKGYVIMHSITTEALDNDGVVEEIVKTMNKGIINDL